jgi:DNA-binding NtrC family response regulator
MNEHICVIEDSEFDRPLIELILKAQGFKVSSYESGNLALEALQAMEQPPQLILSDIMLPDMNGFEVCHRLKAHEPLQNIPIIFLSGLQNYQDIVKGLQAGAVDYITKPFQPEILLSRINIHMTLYQQEQALRKSRDNVFALFNQLRISTVIIDHVGLIEFISDSCQYLLNCDKQQAIGKLWFSIFNFDNKLLQPLVTALEHGAIEQKRWLLTDTNKTYHIEAEAKADPSSPSRHIIYFYDISELYQLKQQKYQSTLGPIVGHSYALKKVIELVQQLACGSWSVLIEGETGTGKELIAKAIHQASSRKHKPFIALNCAGMTESLLTSQLFGHKRGAFTGAIADQEGFFEAANGGTLFLDEIGDIPMTMQSVLLRVLQEQEVTRIGELKPRKVDVRILTATHKNLQEEAREGRFREDLLYRIRIGRITLPPLRDRQDDILLLAKTFLSQNAFAEEKGIRYFSAAAIMALENYAWPGNIRELKACIDYAVIKCRSTTIQCDDLTPELLHTDNKLPALPPEILNEPDETRRILAALQHTGNNRSQAAKLLGMGRATFYRRLEKLKTNI